MPDPISRPFESIESALEFMALLEGELSEASSELRELTKEDGGERFEEALNLALYKMHQLSAQVQKSRRLLNDLRMIRNVLMVEGPSEAVTLPPREI
ncbi:MAG TPA: hypothetical protein VLJ11_18605 [Bryobacteraceae bacterium]|nr:hypothetical protein [Bryobacteraceae bacterium]